MRSLASDPATVLIIGRDKTLRSLDDFGWNPFFEAHFNDNRRDTWIPARVVTEYRELYHVWTTLGEFRARAAGRLRYEQGKATDLPTVGDWVAVEPRQDEGTATIHQVLPHRTAILRKHPGTRTVAQVLAANVDTVFLLTSLNREFNPRRIERFLSLVFESGAEPVLLLNKADLCDDPDTWRSKAAAAAPGVAVHSLSALTGFGTESIARYCLPGQTIVLLGSSGVGKSTLANRLAGHDIFEVRGIREDDARGRHTTSHRQLIPLEPHGLLIDTPGLREVALWDSAGGVGETFEDIQTLAYRCRFTDCRHETEPGCAVLKAVEVGSLDAARFRSYVKLRRELAYLETRQDYQTKLAEKRRWRAITRSMRKHKRARP